MGYSQALRKRPQHTFTSETCSSQAPKVGTPAPACGCGGWKPPQPKPRATASRNRHCTRPASALGRAQQSQEREGEKQPVSRSFLGCIFLIFHNKKTLAILFKTFKAGHVVRAYNLSTQEAEASLDYRDSVSKNKNGLGI